MYQALYRKWRPITFSQVVGQQHITDTLQRQVAEGRTGHAYLFTGTRGTGKTTCARILAKAINCLHPVDGAPCNQCESCRGIDAGKLLDITELDAASNNGVDNVRALREEAVYTPSVLKKRVYIIDEVHMLSTPAFNALLKILEEPPEHLVFILATTELHKVPATILSRCQRFSFKRILPQDIARQLLYIAGEERIDLSPDGADILARMANGAMRDALSLLDQCRSFEGTLNSAAILELLGLAGGVQTAQLMEFILRRSTQDALLHFDRLYRDGKDIAALLRELSDLGRDLLIRRTAPQAQAPKPEPITPVPQPKTSPTGGDSGIWDRLKEHYKAALRVDKRVFLNGASGTLSDGVLTVVCRDEMVKNYLDCPEVNEVLCRVTEKEAGCPVRLVFTLGTVQKSEKHHSTPSAPKQKNTTPPAPEGISKQTQPHPEQIPPWESAPAGTDRMNELLVEGDRLDNFNIK